ncbi:MAG: hypothetical protein A3H42_01750 [Deltaproteobacteria bacterium RIFCSPLOWO2_02_FULL_46_8]|nr:MAG: hypothetical protein A3H42_01750 [Deltaproteobacteria bacterium RIFCSPLOWO2_02_FULL_46_8]
MKLDKPLISKVLSLPTAPFHEEKVMRFIFSFCKQTGLPVIQDSFGNLKVVYKNGNTKPVAMTAHMDHPGFEVVRGGNPSVVRLLGGVPDRFFLNASVAVWDGNQLVKGKVIKIFQKKKREFLVRTQKEVSKNSFGYFDLPGCQFQRGMIYSKGIDNVAGVAILLNLLKECVRKKVKSHLICLFSRAEEVGCVGATGIIKNKFLPKNIPLVVLETSSAKSGGVTIGAGPVLRVGDKFSSFSYRMDLWLQGIAEKLKKDGKNFQYQRALMQGGRCEASVYILAGYETICLAVPLANYHNAGEKNYAAEAINEKDAEGWLKWLLAVAEAPRLQTIPVEEKDFRNSSKRLKRIST